MPPDYASGNGGSATYVAALEASKGMFTKTGVMDADGAKNVLQVLATSNPNVKGKADTVDITKTYTTEFVSKASGA
jgi:NitT/TauT family transport system substrate-binding protein